MLSASRSLFLAAPLSLAMLLAACGSSSSSSTTLSGGATTDSGAGASGGGSTETGDASVIVVNDDAGSNGDSAAPTCAATVAEVQKPQVDIVFVIDDSGSMTDEMNQIKTNVNAFAQSIGRSGLDYHVIFLVAKASSPSQTGNVLCVPPPLASANCADNLPIFRHVNQSIGSHNSLKQILSTYDNADPALAWRGNLRADAYKVFILVSDDQASLTAQDFDTQLLAKTPAGMFGRAAQRRYIFHSIVGYTTGTPLITGPACGTAVNNGSYYQTLSQLTGGIVESICQSDFSGILNLLAQGTSQRLACELTLPTQAGADPTKVAVQVTPPGGSSTVATHVVDSSRCAANPGSWYYDDNTHPTKVLLCPDLCASVNAHQGTKIEALLGCTTEAPR